MDPATIAALASTAYGLFGSKKKGDSNQGSTDPKFYDTRTPDQKAIGNAIAKLLTEGATPYNGARVADLTPNENYLQGASRNLLETSMPALQRILSGEFPEEYFNQAVADPTRRQFNDRVAPVIRENSELTGNRFADRSAIEMGQARGDVESGILQQRGQFGLQSYLAPAQYSGAITGALNNYESLFEIPRQVEQAKLDADFNEFLRTNPQSGGLIQYMLQFQNSPNNLAVMPQGYQSAGPGIVQGAANIFNTSGLGRSANLFGDSSSVPGIGGGSAGGRGVDGNQAMITALQALLPILTSAI